jgi:hypothetical protein
MIKNYTSGTTNTFDKIQKILSSHKAKQIFFEYDDVGRVKALAFSIEVQGKLHAFLLPAHVDKVEAIFYNEKNKKVKYAEWQKDLTDDEKAQAYRTAWANIRDWLDAQMALVDTEQAKVEEVFFPYLATGHNRTLFQDFQENKLQLPSSTKTE